MSEASEARRDGAKLQKNSGRGKHRKGDAIWRGYLVDYKEFSTTFSLSKKVWGKVCTDAVKDGKGLEPLLRVILGDDKTGRVRLSVLDSSHLEYLEDRIEELEALTEELEISLAQSEWSNTRLSDAIGQLENELAEYGDE